MQRRFCIRSPSSPLDGTKEEDQWEGQREVSIMRSPLSYQIFQTFTLQLFQWRNYFRSSQLISLHAHDCSRQRKVSLKKKTWNVPFIVQLFMYTVKKDACVRRAMLMILGIWVCSSFISFPAIAWWRSTASGSGSGSAKPELRIRFRILIICQRFKNI